MEKIIIPSFTKPVIKAPKDQELMQAAQSLEASFLSEMLKAAKLGETSIPTSFCIMSDGSELLSNNSALGRS